jgi:glutaminase
MINSGAIALAALLPGKTVSSRCQNLCRWLNQFADSHLTLDQDMLESVRSLPNPINQAIAHLLSQAGYLDSIETALDTYQQICCLSGTVEDLTKLGLLLAKPHIHLEPIHQRIVNALMLTCGLYQESGVYAVQIGLPIKSGVSGGLLAIVPAEGAIACYSPPLDQSGNSVAGLFLLEQLAQTFNLSVFN